MNAAKENFLFKGYYNRKEKEAEKITRDSIAKTEDDQTAADQKKK